MARKGYFKKTFMFNGKQHTAYGHTQEEAIEKAAVKKAQLEGLLPSEGPKCPYTVEEWADRWLAGYKENTVSDAWYKNMKGITKNYIIPSIGNMKLDSVKPVDISTMMNQYTHLSESHGKKILQITKQLFNTAEDNEYINKNPAKNIKLPQTYKEDETGRAVSEEERRLTLITAEKYPEESLFFLIMLYCGCRPQEVARLVYSDYDKDNRLLKIRRARKASGETGAPKSRSGNRDIPVPDELAIKLDALKRKNKELIVTSQQGRPLTRTSQRRMWKKFKRHMDIENGAELFRNHVVKTTLAEDFVPYCYRHTFATDLRDAGVPITVAAYLMGDSSIEVVANIYTHNTDTAIEDARNKMNNVVWGTKSQEEAESIAI